MKNISRLIFLAILLLSSGYSMAQEFNQPYQYISANDDENIASVREQTLKMEEWLKWRKNHVVPQVMRRSNIDTWILSRREGAIYYTLVDANYEGCISDRSGLLVFKDFGKEKGIEEYTPEYEELNELLKKLKPRKLAISEDMPERALAGIDKKILSRKVSSEDLCTGVLESRSPEELSVFEHVCRVAYDVIADAFSNKVIIPDVTTTDDLNWWIRNRYRELGVGTSDHPTITIQRSIKERKKYSDGDEHFDIEVPPRNGYNKVIRRGDLISCDTGIDYYGLGTDTQSNCYVLREGETDVPEGLKVAMDNTNRLQNHFASAFEIGKHSRDVVNDALKAAFEDGLRPSIYSHPIPYYLMRYDLGGRIVNPRYMAGPDLGGGEETEPAPLLEPGGYPVYENTVYAMELHTWYNVPEWDGQKVRLVLETNVALKKDGIVFLGGRQASWHVVK